MGRHITARGREMRGLIAHAAAKLIAEEGIKDFLVAKRKAAERLGIPLRGVSLPTNLEIEQALGEHQRLFNAEVISEHLVELRRTAQHAMVLFEPFHPRLVGQVLSGNVTRHSAVQLHLFEDSSENVAIHLMQKNIPYATDERKFRNANGEVRAVPVFRFYAGEVEVDSAVFAYRDMRQPPASPIDGKPMRRANLKELEGLLEDV